MAHVRARRGSVGGEYWPGFVDAMATLLLVVTFLLSVFMIAQYFVMQEVSGKDSALKRLTRQIAQLTELLALEKGQKKTLEEELAALTASLASTQADNKRMSGLLSVGEEKAGSASTQAAKLSVDLDAQKDISSEALAKVELLNLQLLALRRQIASLEAALDVSEQKDKESQARIADLGKRLNVALAKKVQELSRYRSDFFGRLRDLLAKRKDVRIVGDRFVFQSEVLFPSGSSELTPEGFGALGPLAQAIRGLERDIPSDIDWVLRVDGHTDVRPIRTPEFPSNWELSSARALSVVRFLIGRGVDPRHLVAAGFGEFQPIDRGVSEAKLRRNRRIELKLTTR